MTIKICVDDEIFSLQDKFGGISKVISNHINFLRTVKLSSLVCHLTTLIIFICNQQISKKRIF